MSPNLFYLIIVLISCAVLLKFFFEASAWFVLFCAGYISSQIDFMPALTLLIIAATYAQIVVVIKGESDVLRAVKQIIKR